MKKRCGYCETWLPVSSFHKQAASSDGLQRRCIDCANKVRRERPARPIAGTHKRCNACGMRKEVEQFGRRASASDGMASHCLRCTAKYHRSNRAQHRALMEAANV